MIGTEDTTSNVDLDEVFSIFDPKTRKGLRGVFKGSARQYQGESERAKEGWLYLDPALVSATRLFEEVNRETPELERFIDETSHLVGDVAQRRDELASLVSNLADTTGALSRPPDALARSLQQLPVPPPGQHHLREPALHARHARPAGTRLQARGKAAAALHRRAAHAARTTSSPP